MASIKRKGISPNKWIEAAIITLRTKGHDNAVKILIDRSIVGTELVKTIDISGQVLRYNPEYVDSIGFDKLVRVLYHEAMHIENEHTLKFQELTDRLKDVFHLAGDLEINSQMSATDLGAPENGAMPGEGNYKDLPKHKTATEYFCMLLSRLDM